MSNSNHTMVAPRPRVGRGLKLSAHVPHSPRLLGVSPKCTFLKKLLLSAWVSAITQKLGRLLPAAFLYHFKNLHAGLCQSSINSLKERRRRKKPPTLPQPAYKSIFQISILCVIFNRIPGTHTIKICSLML